MDYDNSTVRSVARAATTRTEDENNSEHPNNYEDEQDSEDPDKRLQASGGGERVHLEGLVPKDIYRKFARTTSTTLDGNLEVFDEKDLDDVLTAFGRLGYRCIHNDDLIVELR